MWGRGGVNAQFTPVCYVETARPIISPYLTLYGHSSRKFTGICLNPVYFLYKMSIQGKEGLMIPWGVLNCHIGLV